MPNSNCYIVIILKPVMMNSELWHLQAVLLLAKLCSLIL